MPLGRGRTADYEPDSLKPMTSTDAWHLLGLVRGTQRIDETTFLPSLSTRMNALDSGRVAPVSRSMIVFRDNISLYSGWKMARAFLGDGGAVGCAYPAV